MTFIHVYRVTEEFVVDTDSDEPFKDALEQVKQNQVEGREPTCQFVCVQPRGQDNG